MYDSRSLSGFMFHGGIFADESGVDRIDAFMVPSCPAFVQIAGTRGATTCYFPWFLSWNLSYAIISDRNSLSKKTSE
jgi:hypothetical protein